MKTRVKIIGYSPKVAQASHSGGPGILAFYCSAAFFLFVCAIKRVASFEASEEVYEFRGSEGWPEDQGHEAMGRGGDRIMRPSKTKRPVVKRRSLLILQRF